jgi:hypothetical protein
MPLSRNKGEGLPKNELATHLPSIEPVKQSCTSTSYMQVASWRGSEAHADLQGQEARSQATWRDCRGHCRLRQASIPRSSHPVCCQGSLSRPWAGQEWKQTQPAPEWAPRRQR